MATLANIFDRVLSAGSLTADVAGPRVLTRTGLDECRLRTLPNEDVYFFVKRIDNSRVVRQADPHAAVRGWSVVGGASFVAVLLIAMLLPSAYGLMAGYQLNTLQGENQKLVTERARLEMEESRLVSAQRLEALAIGSDFAAPRPESIIYLPPKTGQSLALNRQ